MLCTEIFKKGKRF